MDSDTITVERTIAAPPAEVFALLSDAAKHVEFDGSGTVRGTRRTSEPLALGTRFGMAMHQGFGYRTSNEVVEFEQDRRIAWKTTGLKGIVGGRIWRYELEPVEGGTLVRESWDITHESPLTKLVVKGQGGGARKGMTATLARIEELLVG